MAGSFSALAGDPASDPKVRAANKPASSAASPSSSKSQKPNISLPARPEKKGERQPVPDNVRRLLDEIKNSRTLFLRDQDDLQRKLKSSTEDDREKIRQELREKREQFLEQQKDLREEVLRRVNDLKDELKDHQDLINSAKERSAGKPRKGGND